MMQTAALWTILAHHVPRGEWVSVGRIFSIVESHSSFDKEDLRIYATGTPRWQRNVRRLLGRKKRAGSIQGRRRG